MQWIKQHYLVGGLIIGAVVLGAWYGMTSNSAPEPLITTDVIGNSGSPSEDIADRELVESLLTLRAITLSGSIFTDPAFRSLKDFGTPIVAEPVGRPNPFAPIGQGGSPASTSVPRR